MFNLFKTAPATTECLVGDQQLALHFVDGMFKEPLVTGRYSFPDSDGVHSFQLVDISKPQIDESVPVYILDRLGKYVRTIDIAEYETARLYFDNIYQGLLKPGIYRYWLDSTCISTVNIDTRTNLLEIKAQEILTADKAEVRFNCVCAFHVADYELYETDVDDAPLLIRTAAQLALRDYVGRLSCDELLANKDGIGEFITAELKSLESRYHVVIEYAGVKDIMFPREISEIMRSTLIAQKKAEANVISRREETASTRALLNVAKMLDENPTLHELKRLEYLEQISHNVRRLNINGSGDILTALTSSFAG